VQSMVRAALDEIPGPATHREPIRVVSLCAGQGRDVIDVVATHPRGPEVSALLVELDPALVAFARERAAAAGPGVAERIRIVQGDASQSHWYADDVPADIVLVCGVFGNISAADIKHTIQAMRGFCAPGGHVVWTRHRRPPDLTPTIRADFAEAGFAELAFEAPEGTVAAVGHQRLDREVAPFDPDQQLFDFVGDGWNPA
jgi:ubiquinone/menaquinone biosynthesis C-methylase UbiE